MQIIWFWIKSESSLKGYVRGCAFEYLNNKKKTVCVLKILAFTYYHPRLTLASTSAFDLPASCSYPNSQSFAVLSQVWS